MVRKAINGQEPLFQIFPLKVGDYSEVDNQGIEGNMVYIM